MKIARVLLELLMCKMRSLHNAATDCIIYLNLYSYYQVFIRFGFGNDCVLFNYFELVEFMAWGGWVIFPVNYPNRVDSNECRMKKPIWKRFSIKTLKNHRNIIGIFLTCWTFVRWWWYICRWKLYSLNWIRNSKLKMALDPYLVLKYSPKCSVSLKFSIKRMFNK